MRRAQWEKFSILREDTEEKKRRLLEVASVTATPNKIVRKSVRRRRPRTKACLTDVVIVIEATAQSEVQSRCNVPRCLNISSGLIGGKCTV